MWIQSNKVTKGKKVANKPSTFNVWKCKTGYGFLQTTNDTLRKTSKRTSKSKELQNHKMKFYQTRYPQFLKYKFYTFLWNVKFNKT